MSRVDGYPQPYGAVIESIATHAGPSSYTAVTGGTTPSGGDTLQAAEFGLKFFDSVEVLGLDNTGVYTAYPLFENGIAGQPTSVALMWITANGGAEVAGAVNLSAKTLRIRATGH